MMSRQERIFAYEAGYSIYEIAKMAGVSRAAVSQSLKGRTKMRKRGEWPYHCVECGNGLTAGIAAVDEDGDIWCRSHLTYCKGE